jgi:hypothetical protein
MTLLPQVEAELLVAARRPALSRRISVRTAAAVLAAIAAMLIAAPPTVAHLAVSVGVVTNQTSR